MDTPPPTDAFLDSVPVLTAFENVADVAAYRPLPGDWALATADIVGSTKAIAGGGYKAVNMAGASVISALLNALQRRDLPFVFGGDGAIVAFPQAQRDLVARTLAAVQAWVKDELGLELRSAIVPLADIRARGFDVRVGTFQFRVLGRARIANEIEGFVKIVADKKYDEVLGVHMIGPRSTELIAEAVLALRLECTVEELIRTMHAHPTFSEAVGEAAHATHGAAIHM